MSLLGIGLGLIQLAGLARGDRVAQITDSGACIRSGTVIDKAYKSGIGLEMFVQVRWRDSADPPARSGSYVELVPVNLLICEERQSRQVRRRLERQSPVISFRA